MRNAKIGRKVCATDQIDDRHERHAGNDHRHGRKAVEAIGQVHSVAERHDHEGGEKEVEGTKLDGRAIVEGQIKRRISVLIDDQPGRYARNQELERQAHLARQPLVAGLRHLVIIVQETDRTKTQRHEQACPDVDGR